MINGYLDKCMDGRMVRWITEKVDGWMIGSKKKIHECMEGLTVYFLFNWLMEDKHKRFCSPLIL